MKSFGLQNLKWNPWIKCVLSKLNKPRPILASNASDKEYQDSAIHVDVIGLAEGIALVTPAGRIGIEDAVCVEQIACGCAHIVQQLHV